MKPMSYYRQVAINNIEKAMASANASSAIKHSLLKGRLREVVVSELIQPFLTPHARIATGTIVDHHGNQSNQIDIIIYDERITPPILITESEGMIPCHSVLATVEVKSRLNLTEVRKAVLNARSVKTLEYDYDTIELSGERGYEMAFQKMLLKMIDDSSLREQIRHSLFDINSPACFIFAFGSDLSRSGTILDERDRLLNVVQDYNKTKPTVQIPVSGLCIVDRGFTYCSAYNLNPPVILFECVTPDLSAQKKPRGRKYWASYNVVLKFESTIINTCAVHSHQRWRIPLDVYFEQ